MEKKKVSSATTKKTLTAVAVAAVAVVAISGAYGAYLVSRYGSGNAQYISRGISVDGIDVGGLSQDAAQQKINDEKLALAENTVELVMDDNLTTARFEEFDIDYNVDSAVKQAAEYGKKGNIFSRIAKCFNISRGKVDIKTDAKVNDEQVSDYVSAYSQAIGSTVVENSYSIVDDKLELTPGKSGTGIDKELIANEITQLLKSGASGKIGVSLIPIDPQPWNVDTIYDEVCQGPSDAEYKVIDGKGYIVEAKKGYKFKKSDLSKLVENIDGKAVLELDVTEPKNKKVDESGLFKEVIAKYTSSLAGSSYNRRTNVEIASKSVNGTILNPDEVFSYNKTVGAVTTANGYLPATIFTSKGHEEGVGGGICQLSSTLYSAALEGNLEIVKRRNHMYIVGYVPYGQDATVYEGELDFRFKNNTNEPLKITAAVTNGTLVVQLLGKKPDPDIKVEIENITVGRTAPPTTVREDDTLDVGTVKVVEKGTIGLTVDTYKKIYKNGELLSREYLHRSVYKPISRVEVHGTKPVEAPEVSESPDDATLNPEQTAQPSNEQPTESTSNYDGI